MRYILNDQTTLLAFARMRPSNVTLCDEQSLMTRAMTHHPLFEHVSFEEADASARPGHPGTGYS